MNKEEAKEYYEMRIDGYEGHSVDHTLKTLMADVLTHGNERDTRSGKVTSVFKRDLQFDLRNGFPVTTSKKLAWMTCVGELLTFLSGKSCIKTLKHYTFGDENSDKWTIWSDDLNRWNTKHGTPNDTDLGEWYATQWRAYPHKFGDVDQITNLIHNLKENPTSRYLVVQNYNAGSIHNDSTCLGACHVMFQCYVEDGYLDLDWSQRSVDSFLGLPVNIASYALLQHLLAAWTGLKPRYLSASLKDVHIYENHLEAVDTYISNEAYPLPELILPEKAKEGLDSLLELTALDFKDCLKGYQHAGVVKAPLSVG